MSPIPLIIAASILLPAADVQKGKKPTPTFPSSKDMRQTISRSVEFLHEEGVYWIKERGCVSCHQVPSMLWSLQEAKRLGLGQEKWKLEEWTQWSVDWRHWMAKKLKASKKEAESKNVDTMVHLLLGRGKAHAKAPWVKSFVTNILREQKEDGSWTFGGQLGLQHRSKVESKQVTTMWTLLALATAEDSARTEAARQNAWKWLKNMKPGESTEWAVTRLLLEHKFGDKSRAKQYLKELLKEQNPDGGWGWLRGKTSDAFGSGLVLYALAQMGHPLNDASVRRTWHYLQMTQEKAGSWPVPTTLKRHKGNLEPTSVYWGTAWAVIGLAETLRPSNSPS